MSTRPGIPGVDIRVRHRGDPAAQEVLAIREWATTLAGMADDWLTARETYRAHQAEQAEAREHRAATELSRRQP
ncbi:hypothetical protein QEN35_13005 [Gordonia alkanivorans]|uniref:hypothetical protein n=1 Tax=Gordonia TaxID=2053 RepID=UPI0012BB36C6|nr:MULTISPECIES: hypothetical protein [Gordonia]MDH3025305.1 hypothetical protein [Gordonia alkanivorans]QGP87290.1 hypothetical protein GKZ92_06325 [Gordonia sp. 135]